MSTERELPMLAAIAGFLRWIEELLNILNGPILMFGAGIALVDLLTDGALTVSMPELLYAWAISQALGIDTQLLGCFARARLATGWRLVGWLILGVVLGFAAWQAGYVFAVQQSEHITESQALAQLHMSPALWLGWRTFLAVGLVALSGWTRYIAPNAGDVALDERERLARELELEPMRAELRARKALGWRGVATALGGRAAIIHPNIPEMVPPADAQPEADPPDPPEPPMRPNGRENSAHAGNEEWEGQSAAPSLALVSRTGASRRPVARKPSPERSQRLHAYALLDDNPAMTKTALREALRCRQERATALYNAWQHSRERKQVASR